MMNLGAIGASSLFVVASTALAQPATWSGDTSSGPFFARPFSFVGTAQAADAVPFHVQPFFVKAGGQYVFEADYRGELGAWDGYILVYRNTFNSAMPLANLIAGDDDWLGPFTVLPGETDERMQGSRIALGETTNFGGAGTGLLLTPDTQYYAVVTGFLNSSSGTFTAGIGGPGQVNLGVVPAPASVAVLGVAGIVATRRRR
jgi:hypothetical protein